MSAEPPWWRRVGLGFIGGIGEGDVVPAGQVKTALWGLRWRDRRGKHRGNSLEVEDGAADLAGDDIDNGSSSGAVDEGRRAVAVDDVVREESPAGRRSGGRGRSVRFRGFWRPRCTNGGMKGKVGGAMA